MREKMSPIRFDRSLSDLFTTEENFVGVNNMKWSLREQA